MPNMLSQFRKLGYVALPDILLVLDSDWNQKLFKVLSTKYGNITETVAMEDVMTGLGTGDLHAIAFDVTGLKIWVANAGLNATPAYKRVYVPYDLKAALKSEK